MTHSLSLPPLESLTAVLAAGRTGSFSAAALELGVTHAAISRRVQAAEAWLGVALFERHGRGVRTTPDGDRFIARVGEAFTMIARSGDQWRQRRGTEIVRLSILPAFAKLWLFRALDKLQDAHLRFDMQVEHRLADLEKGEVDIAVRCGNGQWADVSATPLFREMVYPVAAPSLAARLGRDAGVQAILAETLVHDSTVTSWRAWLAAHGVAYSKPRPQDIRFEDYDTVLAALEAGLGIGMLRSPLGDPWVANGRLVPISPLWVPNPYLYHLVTRTGTPRPAVAEARDRLLALAAEFSPVPPPSAR
ncbi:LysR substrate-binding domain-containing protein [Niveispirillum sp. KHB5.9]|uniref:LysR substrate-binding domain-containing protein n=1 Tax=Niveispirillum sp. KHB5.9 TaxID=3400269 RepID=UPI003A840AD9